MGCLIATATATATENIRACWSHTLFACYTRLGSNSVQITLRHFHSMPNLFDNNVLGQKKLIAELSVSDWVSLLAQKVLMKSVFLLLSMLSVDFTCQLTKKMKNKKQNVMHCSCNLLHTAYSLYLLLISSMSLNVCLELDSSMWCHLRCVWNM